MAIRVMAVDQSTAIREVLRAALARSGEFDLVAEAANGRAAVQEAVALRPDVVLMDVDLPLQSGLEAAAQITERLPDTRVVFFSNAPISRTLARRAGASAVVPKRMLGEELFAAIRRVTGRSPAGARPLPSGALSAVPASASAAPLAAGADRLAPDVELTARLVDVVAAVTALVGLFANRLATPSRRDAGAREQPHRVLSDLRPRVLC